MSAYEFSKYKNDIIFIEKENYLGGRIKTIKSNLSVFEIGSQFFCKSDAYIWKLIKRKKLQNDLVKLDFSNMSFFFKDKLRKDVNEAENIIKNVIEKYEKNKKAKYFYNWFFKNFDKEKIYIPHGIIRAITFSDSSKILTDYGVYILTTFFDDCFTFKNGLEELIYSLSKNCKIENQTVKKLIFKDNKLISIKTDKDKIDTTNNIVISTAPPPDIKIENHRELNKNFINIKFNGCAVLIFRIKKNYPEKPDYIFFPENKYKVSVIEQMSIDNNYFIGCLIPHDFKIEKKDTTAYSKKLLGKILNCYFEENIIETYYTDWTNGLPLVNENYLKTINKINNMKFSNLLFIGDYTAPNPSMDSAVKSGFAIQQKIEKMLH